ncbi:hypothetical protein [uncultured Alistipes sp.]|uniref:hypothetical protein n=1 Tax=uncultured Alistipes sp. TaxID=538949 RepID=UPI00266EC288|nr:hypothetical protein [uncultured Alistipes sp.]
MTDQKTKCDPCEERFQENIREIVNEGKGESGSERRRNEADAREAFGGAARTGEASSRDAATAQRREK